MVPEVLQAGSTVLRRLRLADVEPMFEAACRSTREVGPWLPWCHTSYRIEECQRFVRQQVAFWDEGVEFDYAIRGSQDEFVGSCCLLHLNREHRSANLGYWVRSDFAGRGYATAAVRLVAEAGIQFVGLWRVEIIVAKANLPSQRVAERAGAVREGVLRNRLCLHGQAHDAVVLSITPNEVSGSAAHVADRGSIVITREKL